jgi:hypothetical protein
MATCSKGSVYQGNKCSDATCFKGNVYQNPSWSKSNPKVTCSKGVCMQKQCVPNKVFIQKQHVSKYRSCGGQGNPRSPPQPLEIQGVVKKVWRDNFCLCHFFRATFCISVDWMNLAVLHLYWGGVFIIILLSPKSARSWKKSPSPVFPLSANGKILLYMKHTRLPSHVERLYR